MGVRIMRNFIYDNEFMKEEYKFLVEHGFSDAEILTFYNQFWLDEARNTYTYKHRHVSMGHFEVGTLDITCCWDTYPSDGDATELLKMVSPRQRQIVTLKARGRKQKEIAKRIGISDAAVSKQFAAARGILHDHYLALHLITA